jgi:hypothetical protein
MSHERNNSSENSDSLEPIQRTLSSFSPAPAQIDRDRLMFRAGQANVMASGGREAFGCEGDSFNPITGKLTLPARRAAFGPHWLWPASTAAFATTSLALAMALLIRPTPEPLIVHRDGPNAELAASAPQQGKAPTVDSALATAQQAMFPGESTRVPENNYVRIREVALRMGLDAIGSPGAVGHGSSAPVTYGDLLEGLAGVRRQTEPAARLENSSNM